MVVDRGARRPDDRALARALAVVAVAALAFTACSQDEPDDQPTIAPESSATTTTTTGADGVPAARTSYVAQARGELDVWQEADSSDTTTLSSKDEGSDLLTFLVIDRRNDGWLEVILPTEPLATGFVREDDVVLTRHRYRIEVSLSRREIVLFAGAVEAARAKVAIGPDVPDAGTATFIKELRAPEFMTLYGSPVYGLGGAANKPDEFKAGKGVVAFHSVEPAMLGKPLTAGSIGLDPALLHRFTTEFTLPLGTPVDIIE